MRRTVFVFIITLSFVLNINAQSYFGLSAGTGYDKYSDLNRNQSRYYTYYEIKPQMGYKAGITYFLLPKEGPKLRVTLYYGEMIFHYKYEYVHINTAKEDARYQYKYFELNINNNLTLIKSPFILANIGFNVTSLADCKANGYKYDNTLMFDDSGYHWETNTYNSWTTEKKTLLGLYLGTKWIKQFSDKWLFYAECDYQLYFNKILMSHKSGILVDFGLMYKISK